MRTARYNAVITAIKKRQELEQQVKVIEGSYRPRIDRLVAAMNKRSYKKMIKIRTLTTTSSAALRAERRRSVARSAGCFPT